MNNSPQKRVQALKVWVAPKLKKIGVEQLTSHPFNLGDIGDS